MGLLALRADLRQLTWEEYDFNWSETNLFWGAMRFFQGTSLQLHSATVEANIINQLQWEQIKATLTSPKVQANFPTFCSLQFECPEHNPSLPP